MNSYGVRCIFACPKAAFNTLDYLYEERITVWRAKDINEALDRAIEEAYVYSRTHSFEYGGLAQAFWMFSELPIDGIEVFSLLRESNLHLEEYLSTFLAREPKDREKIQQANKTLQLTPSRLASAITTAFPFHPHVI
jgi:hypothetical protein